MSNPTASMKVAGSLCTTLLAVSLLAAAGAAGAADQKAAPSKPLQKPLAEIETLLKANQFPEALEKIHAADAMPEKSPYDQHLIYQFSAYACSKTNDVPCLSKALKGQIDDGFTTADDNHKYTRAVSVASYQQKNYDQAIDFGNRAIKGGFATDEIYQIVAQAYYLKDDYKGAAQFEEARVAELVKKGQTPKADELNLYVSACAKAKDDPCVLTALERTVTYYPKPETWSELLAFVRQKANGDLETLQTYRLMSDVGAMKTSDDYLEMAALASDHGSPGDAEHTLQAGIAAGAFAGAKSQRAQTLLAAAKRAGASDQASLGRAEHEADAASNGVKNAGAGLAYLGYQQYDKAADQLGKAVSKGGLKNEADTRLLLGIAQLKSAHKDDAVKTFQSVKGSPVMEHLAALWVIRAQQP